MQHSASDIQGGEDLDDHINRSSSTPATHNFPRSLSLSEQSSQFRQRPLINPATRPAGKTMPKGKEYSHLLQQQSIGVDAGGHSSKSLSSFMSDFTDPWKWFVYCRFINQSWIIVKFTARSLFFTFSLEGNLKFMIV